MIWSQELLQEKFSNKLQKIPRLVETPKDWELELSEQLVEDSLVLHVKPKNLRILREPDAKSEDELRNLVFRLMKEMEQ